MSVEIKPIVLLDPNGDIRKERDLVHFSMNQREILKNLMSFNNLEQDSRKIVFPDSSVIDIHSCMGRTIINIFCPKEGKLEEPEKDYGIIVIRLFEEIYDLRGAGREFVIWDINTDDYFAAQILDEGTGLVRKVLNSEWPLRNLGSIVNLELTKRATTPLVFKPISVSETTKSFTVSYDYRLDNIIVGDYVWRADNPSKHGKITKIKETEITTDVLVITNNVAGSNHHGVFVSPVFPTWYISQDSYFGEYIWEQDPNVQYSYIASQIWQYTYDTITEVTTSEVVAVDPVARKSSFITDYGGVPTLYTKYKSFVENRELTFERLAGRQILTPIGMRYYTEEEGNIFSFTTWDDLPFLTEYEPPTDNAWFRFYYPDQSPPYGSKSWGLNTWSNDEFEFQLNVLSGYATRDNIICQCKRRTSPGSVPSEVRSTKLENAILNLITVARSRDVMENPLYIENLGNPIDMGIIKFTYYSEKRK